MSATDESTIDVVRKATRELARSFDYTYWREKDKCGEYPWEFVNAFANGGWLGALIPDEYGGLGLGITECGVMMQEIAASGAGASGASAESVAVAPSLAWNSDDALQDDLVRKQFRRNLSRPVQFVPTAEGFGAAVRCGAVWAGGCSRKALPDRTFGTVRSCGSPTYTSTCRCSGSAGNSTARWSFASPMQGGQPPPTGARASRWAPSAIIGVVD